MIRKTYAARGLLDWQIALNVGGAVLRICFSGGSMGTNGVLPAKYTTDNPVIQKMIEDSPHFKSHRVYLFSSQKLQPGKKEDEDKH